MIPNGISIEPPNGAPVVGSIRLGSFSTSLSIVKLMAYRNSALPRVAVGLLKCQDGNDVAKWQSSEFEACVGSFMRPTSRSSTTVRAVGETGTTQRSSGP